MTIDSKHFYKVVIRDGHDNLLSSFDFETKKKAINFYAAKKQEIDNSDRSMVLLEDDKYKIKEILGMEHPGYMKWKLFKILKGELKI